jgi:hypothetical protein
MLSRRALLVRTGQVAAATALATIVQPANQQQQVLAQEETLTLEANFFVQDGVTSLINPLTTLFDEQSQTWGINRDDLLAAYPWTVGQEMTTAAAMANVSQSTVEELEAWAQIQCNEGCTQSNQIVTSAGIAKVDAIMQQQLFGAPDVSELIGQVLGSVLDGKQIDVALGMYQEVVLGDLNQQIFLPWVSTGESHSVNAADVSYIIKDITVANAVF